MMKRVVKNISSLYWKLMIAFFIVILPIFIISLLINIHSERMVREEISHSMQSRIQFYFHLLDKEIAQTEKMQREFINDRDLRKLTDLFTVINNTERRDAILATYNRLNQLSKMGSIQDISIYLPGAGKKISSANVYTDLPREEYEAMLTAYRSGRSVLFWNNRLFISFAYSELALINKEQPKFVITAEVARNEVQNILSELKINQKGIAILTDTHSQWWVMPVNETLTHELSMNELLTVLSESGANQETSATVTLNDTTYLVNQVESASHGYSMILLMPISEILSPLTYYQNLFWILIGISVVMVALFSYWIYLQIHKPMRDLLRAFRKVEKGDLQTFIQPTRSDEFHYLYQQFNLMIGRIHQLVHEVYEQKYRANLAELQKLQSQINPHFLYNIFFTLSRVILHDDIEKSSAFVKYLGEYFQYMFKYRDEVLLQDEMKFVQTYIHIQTFRFEDRIRTEVAPLPKRARTLYVPKLILQPIIENAYIHGLKNKVAEGTLSISFTEQDDALRIIVEDNGSGLPGPDLIALHARLSDSNNLDSSALINVHRRLKLKFGEAAGLKMLNRTAGGLKVELVIPYSTEAPTPDTQTGQK